MDEVWFCFSLTWQSLRLTCAGPVFAYNKENVLGLTTNSAADEDNARSLVTELLIHVK